MEIGRTKYRRSSERIRKIKCLRIYDDLEVNEAYAVLRIYDDLKVI